MKSVLAIVAAGVLVAWVPSAAWARGGHVWQNHYARHGHHRLHSRARVDYGYDPYGYGYRALGPSYAYRGHGFAPTVLSIGGYDHHDSFRANHGYTGTAHAYYGHGGLGYGGSHSFGGHGYGREHGYGGGHGGEHQ